jgi:hypothetical protein
MDAHVQLNVPPEAETAKLLHRQRRWGMYYRSLVSAGEAVVEFHQIDVDLLVADDIDPADSGAVAAHVEHGLQAAGFDPTRLVPEGEPVAASWDLRPRTVAGPVMSEVREAVMSEPREEGESIPAPGPSTEGAAHFALLGAGLRPPRRPRR